ncbi:hypothetical protein YC2023_058733 [Brassica napus]
MLKLSVTLESRDQRGLYCEGTCGTRNVNMLHSMPIRYGCSNFTQVLVQQKHSSIFLWLLLERQERCHETLAALICFFFHRRYVNVPVTICYLSLRRYLNRHISLGPNFQRVNGYISWIWWLDQSEHSTD